MSHEECFNPKRFVSHLLASRLAGLSLYLSISFLSWSFSSGYKRREITHTRYDSESKRVKL